MSSLPQSPHHPSSTLPNLIAGFASSGPRVVIEEDDDDDDDDDDTPHSMTSGDSREPASAVQHRPQSESQPSSSSAGWLHILKHSDHIPNTNTPTEQERVDYFALCMAAHFSTVATFVPTDVDRCMQCTDISLVQFCSGHYCCFATSFLL